jgi:hypothetical protein
MARGTTELKQTLGVIPLYRLASAQSHAQRLVSRLNLQPEESQQICPYELNYE